MSELKVAWYEFEKYAFLVNLRPRTWGPWAKEELNYIHYDIKGGEAKGPILKLTSVFHHVGSKQLCVSANLGCTHEASTSYNTLKLTKRNNKRPQRTKHCQNWKASSTTKKRFYKATFVKIVALKVWIISNEIVTDRVQWHMESIYSQNSQPTHSLTHRFF